jgi:hypothetical protein
VGYHNDEFRSFLGAMDMHKGGGIGGHDRAEWIKMFDNSGKRRVELVGAGSVLVPNWSASILSAITPEGMQKISKYLPEDGLFHRFLVVQAQDRTIPDLDTMPHAEMAEARGHYATLLWRLWDLKPHVGVGVSLSREALVRFHDWRKQNLELQKAFRSLDPALEGHLAKYDNILLRVTLTFHCVWTVHKEPQQSRDPVLDPVSLETLELAIRFLHTATNHAMAVYVGRTGSSTVYALAQDVARLIIARSEEENAKGLQWRDVLKRVSNFAHAEPREQEHAMKLLVDSGWIRDLDPAAGGGYRKDHPTRYAVNPRLGAAYRDMAERERQRRTLVVERIQASAVARRSSKRDGG